MEEKSALKKQRERAVIGEPPWNPRTPSLSRGYFGPALDSRPPRVLQTHRSPPGLSERLWDRFISLSLEPSPLVPC